MAADKETIVCYHTPKTVPIQDTKVSSRYIHTGIHADTMLFGCMQPLRRRKVWERKSLTDEEVCKCLISCICVCSWNCCDLECTRHLLYLVVWRDALMFSPTFAATRPLL